MNRSYRGQKKRNLIRVCAGHINIDSPPSSSVLPPSQKYCRHQLPSCPFVSFCVAGVLDLLISIRLCFICITHSVPVLVSGAFTFSSPGPLNGDVTKSLLACVCALPYNHRCGGLSLLQAWNSFAADIWSGSEAIYNPNPRGFPQSIECLPVLIHNPFSSGGSSPAHSTRHVLCE